MTEKFALDHGLRHGTAIDRHEPPFLPEPEIVKRAGCDFFAGACLTEKKYISLCFCKRSKGAPQTLDGGRIADKPTGNWILADVSRSKGSVFENKATMC
jgi:hypothetical protein